MTRPLLGGWLAVCGLKREAQIWGGRAVVGGGQTERLADKIETALIAGRVRGLVSFGLAGALGVDLAVGDVVVASDVVHAGEGWPCDPATVEVLAVLLGVAPRVVVGSATVVADPAAKPALSVAGAAVDMESQVAARAAVRYGLPLAVLRVISDAADDVLPPAAIAGFRADGDIDVAAVVSALVRDPRQLPALLAAGRNSGVAFRRLKEVRAALGYDFLLPRLGGEGGREADGRGRGRADK